jgi:large subunit ribosomal protein LP0
MQKIRTALRGKAVMLMGKNTMIRKALRSHIQSNPAIEALLPYIKGNIGFVFTNGDLSEIKKIITENKVAAPAKQGAIAPCDVIVPAGPTGLEPTMTGFLQALNIPTKIVKGQIEIQNPVQVITAGNKVGASEANLLAKLNIKPFQYGLQIKTVYDNGSIYDPSVLDLTDDDLIKGFQNGVRNIAAIGLQIGYPTIATVPHSIINGWKNILAVSLATEYTIEATEQLKKFLENPEAFAAAAPVPSGEGAPPVEEKKEQPKEEEEEEADVGGLFGDDF